MISRLLREAVDVETQDNMTWRIPLFSSSQLELPDRTLLHGPLDVGSQDSKAERGGLN